MGVRHFEKSAFRALFVHPEHNGPQHNMIMVQFQDNQGARPGQSGEGNFQWGGRPRPPAGASRRRIRARNMSPDGSLPPLAAGGRGRPPH